MQALIETLLDSPLGYIIIGAILLIAIFIEFFKKK